MKTTTPFMKQIAIYSLFSSVISFSTLYAELLTFNNSTSKTIENFFQDIECQEDVIYVFDSFSQYLIRADQNIDPSTVLIDPRGKQLELANIQKNAIIRGMSEFVRDYTGSKEGKARLLAILNPLLVDILDGNVEDISPLHGLMSLYCTVFKVYGGVYIQPGSSPQRDFLLEMLLKAIRSEVESVKYRAVPFLYTYAFCVPEAKEKIISEIAKMPEYESENDVEFEYSHSQALAVIVSHDEFYALDTMTLSELVREAVAPKNRSKESLYNRLMREKFLDGDHVSDMARSTLLSEMRYIDFYSSPVMYNNWGRLVSPALMPEDTLSLEEKQTRDAFYSALRQAMDAKKDEESLLWATTILYIRLKEDILRGDVHAQFYGWENIVVMLKHIFYSELEWNKTFCMHRTEKGLQQGKNDVRSDTLYLVSKSLCILKQINDDKINNDIIFIFSDFMLGLVRRNADWSSEEWFLKGARPESFKTSRYADAFLYHTIKKYLNIKNCSVFTGYSFSRPEFLFSNDGWQ